ncbi:unnamed protein product [Medioppia subpectinata]|uniref:Uncharacterized protein n=1 Tax=Medioppia subpectinata TaxID=1979941 RepID=A0A7R9PUP9_9ACAR|nr:unnamed protein product [Medioppia subpectinata]CAG2101823.1 unnamed protein product [Medioppia subpectinata]
MVSPGGTQLSCYNITEPLGDLFKRLSNTLQNDTELYQLFLHSTVDTLEANVFGQLIFDQLGLDMDKLANIHKDAFAGTAVKGLSIAKSAISDVNDQNNQSDYGLFKTIRATKSLKSIYMASSKLTAIPDGAFQSATYLESITFSGTPLKRIGQNAFYDAARLHVLTLSGVQLETIDAHAFNVGPRGGGGLRALDIRIEQADLNQQILKPSSFEMVNDKVNLYLEYSDFDYLDETVFGTFLLNQTTHVIYTNNLICHDERNQWLYAKYRNNWKDNECN